MSTRRCRERARGRQQLIKACLRVGIEDANNDALFCLSVVVPCTVRHHQAERLGVGPCGERTALSGARRGASVHASQAVVLAWAQSYL